jgi:hypothetical protein
MTSKRKSATSHPPNDIPQEPEISSTEGSAALERLRAAEFEEGRGPAREGADPDRDHARTDPRATRE